MLWEHISKHLQEEDMRLDAKTADVSKYEFLASNAAATSALSKRMASGTGEVIETVISLLNAISSLRGKRYV